MHLKLTRCYLNKEAGVAKNKTKQKKTKTTWAHKGKKLKRKKEKRIIYLALQTVKMNIS